MEHNGSASSPRRHGQSTPPSTSGAQESPSRPRLPPTARPSSPAARPHREQPEVSLPQAQKVGQLLDELTDYKTENRQLKNQLAQQQKQHDSILEAQLLMHRDQVDKLRQGVDRESEGTVAAMQERDSLMGELDNLKNGRAQLLARVEDAEKRAGLAETLELSANRRIAGMSLAIKDLTRGKNALQDQYNMVAPQLQQVQEELKKEKATRMALQLDLQTLEGVVQYERKLQQDMITKRQTAPLGAMDSVEHRDKEAAFDAMHQQFEEQMEEMRKKVENQQAGMYQRKVDDMEERLMAMEERMETHQQNADSAKKDCRALAQKNDQLKEELETVRSDFEQHKERETRRQADHAATIQRISNRYRVVMDEKKALVEQCAALTADKGAVDVLLRSQADGMRAAGGAGGQPQRQPDAGDGGSRGGQGQEGGNGNSGGMWFGFGLWK